MDERRHLSLLPGCCFCSATIAKVIAAGAVVAQCRRVYTTEENCTVGEREREREGGSVVRAAGFLSISVLLCATISWRLYAAVGEDLIHNRGHLGNFGEDGTRGI